MKKVFALMAVAAMFAVACSKDDDNKKDDPKPDPKPVDEYTGPVEGTSEWSLIGDLLEKSWDTDWVAAQDGDIYVVKNVKLTTANAFKFRKNKDWGENRGAEGDVEPFVMTTGEGTPVVHNGKNLSVAADGIYDIYYNSAKEQMAVCESGKAPSWKEGSTPAPTGAITIDGDFADWAALKDGTYAKALNDPDSPWEGVKEIRCYADPDHVFYYIRYDSESLEELLANGAEVLPIRLCINTDGEFESGYTSYFLEGYDFIVEGDLAENGAFVGYDGTFYQRIGKWVELAGEGVGLVTGTGKGNEYEIMLDRVIFNQYANTSSVPMPMGDSFQTGIRFYFINEAGKWDELSNMPNVSIEEEMGNGYGYLLRVTTQK